MCIWPQKFFFCLGSKISWSARFLEFVLEQHGFWIRFLSFVLFSVIFCSVLALIYMFLIYADISRHKKLLYCMYISDLWYYRANSMYQHVSRKSISSQSLQILTYAVFFWNYDACNVLLPRYPMKIIYLQHHMRTIYSPENAQCCILLIGGTSDEYLLRGGGAHWLVKFGPLKNVNGWSKKGPIFKISKLAASFEALSHLRAIKTGDSWAWCTKFGAKTWFFTEMQGNC